MGCQSGRSLFIKTCLIDLIALGIYMSARDLLNFLNKLVKRD